MTDLESLFPGIMAGRYVTVYLEKLRFASFRMIDKPVLDDANLSAFALMQWEVDALRLELERAVLARKREETWKDGLNYEWVPARPVRDGLRLALRDVLERMQDATPCHAWRWSLLDWLWGRVNGGIRTRLIVTHRVTHNTTYLTCPHLNVKETYRHINYFDPKNDHAPLS